MEKKVTKEEAEARALELYPILEEFDVDRLKPLREAYLQGWDDLQVAMDAKQAADEVDRDKQKEKINALLVTALRELTDSESLVLIKALQERNPLYNKQTCGFCVEPATELTDEKHSETLDTKENEGSELPSEKQKEKQTCGFCVERKQHQKELLKEMMRKDEEDGVYEHNQLREATKNSKKH
jgi:hypothetical protein